MLSPAGPIRRVHSRLFHCLAWMLSMHARRCSFPWPRFGNTEIVQSSNFEKTTANEKIYCILLLTPNKYHLSTHISLTTHQQESPRILIVSLAILAFSLVQGALGEKHSNTQNLKVELRQKAHKNRHVHGESINESSINESSILLHLKTLVAEGRRATSVRFLKH